MKIGIVGRSKDTLSYEKYLYTLKIPYITSLSMGELGSCDALIFPGGGDITPQLFHQSNQGSQNIDTELDLFQLRAFDLAYRIYGLLYEIKNQYADKTVLLVCHNCVSRMIRSFFVNMSTEEYGNYHAPNAQLVEYEL